ncbi:hypothetical protein GNIT_3383 [Glaciecola nitratireducens FR1064]|uniref:Uncharacterized protein n=1 Tax=Glaciecola nitratireducens (strain JCM 12485 / KCTC 12276 / FR1064) TaxID=1085623 RepID=G4QN59_GLANF|nr:hypothetical protein GNIT_3383 [Glaciecola nitratireducens FR1064]
MPPVSVFKNTVVFASTNPRVLSKSEKVPVSTLLIVSCEKSTLTTLLPAKLAKLKRTKTKVTKSRMPKSFAYRSIKIRIFDFDIFLSKTYFNNLHTCMRCYQN